MSIDNILCPICGSSQTNVHYLLKGHKVVRCKQCHLMYNPDFPPENINGNGAFEQDYYFDVQKEAFEIQLDDYRNDPSVPMFEKGLSRIEALLDGKKGQILDVGSALGTFLKVAEDRGWEVQGVELSKYGADYASKKYNMSVFNGDLTDAPFSPSKYDCITFWDVIEHQEKPLENLRKAFELLKPGGILLVTSDNYDCLLTTVADLIYRITNGSVSYAINRLYIPFNKSYFIDQEFLEVLKNIGFEISFFEKMDYPILKINANILERTVLRLLYLLGDLTNRQAQFISICTKPRTDVE